MALKSYQYWTVELEAQQKSAILYHEINAPSEKNCTFFFLHLLSVFYIGLKNKKPTHYFEGK